MKTLSAAILVGTVVISSPSLAWNNFGHMEVAAVAWSKLDPAVKEKVSALIKLNPMFDVLAQGASDAEKDQIAFVRAATWPDMIKQSHDYHADGANNGDVPPPGPEASQNIGYSDHFMHKYWHFVDRPFSTDGTMLVQPSAPNAQTQIGALRKVLPDANAAPDLKSYDLVWLLHLIGDVHQPLHATSRFSRDFPKGDAGGNDVKIRCGGGCKQTELHAFWDDILGTSNDPHDAIAAAAALAAPDADKASIGDEVKWIDESFAAAKQSAYRSPIKNGKGPFTLTGSYKSNALKVAKQRVALAGARLANLLNASFK